MRGLELRGVDGSLDRGDPGEGSEGQKPGGGAETRRVVPGRPGSKGQELGWGFDGKNSLVFGWKKGGNLLEIIQKDGTRLVVAMDGSWDWLTIVD